MLYSLNIEYTKLTVAYTCPKEKTKKHRNSESQDAMPLVKNPWKQTNVKLQLKDSSL